MRKIALQIEHKFKNRVVGNHLVGERSSITTLGSSRSADIRLLGDEVAGMHAAFDLQDGVWTLCDLGSDSGTWINKKPVVEQKIDGATVIHIGNHQLKATPHMVERDLFAKDLAEPQGKYTYHQAVVLKKGLLHKTFLFEQKDAFQAPHFGTLPAPTTFDWTVTAFGEFTVKQRLTRTDVLQETLGEQFIGDWKRPAPAIGALLMVLLVFGVMVLVPQQPDNELKTLTPELQNQYTRMIFDGKKVRKQKEQSEKARKNIQGQSQTGVAKNTPGGDAGSKNAGGNKATPGAKVVMNLKNAGLGALIGKVAARAGKNAQLVQAAGVSPDQSSGRALGLGGGSSLDKLGGGGGGTGGETMKVGGLGTAGKGGGVNGFKGSGALSLGNIGNAEVGVLEEESEIDGGLDKEAIARVIRSQLGQIRYCYERQLSASPDLYGKIMIKFTIGAAGSVVAQAIGNTSLKQRHGRGMYSEARCWMAVPHPKGWYERVSHLSVLV